MRCIYLQNSLSMNGRDSLRGRKLYDEFKKQGETLLKYVIVSQESARQYNPAVMGDVIPEVTFLEFNPDLLFIESGLFTGSDGTWKVDQRIAQEFVEAGGVVIVSDVDLNLLRTQREAYKSAVGFIGAGAAYRGAEPVGGYDEVRYWGGNKQILCKPDEMVLSNWLRPVYQDIPEILVGLPVRLALFDSILASGNTRSTWSDATDGIPGPDNLPFAAVRKRGKGFIVFIAGLVSGDAWLEGCQHNTRWLINVSKFLVNEAAKEQQRRASHLLSDDRIFLSHSKADEGLVRNVFQILKSDYALAPWFDEDKLVPGAELPVELKKAVGESTIFLLFWSTASSKSRWVAREIKAALLHKDILFIIIRTAKVPMVARLANRLWIEAFDAKAEDIAKRVVKTIQESNKRRRIEKLKAATEVSAVDLKQNQGVTLIRKKARPASLTRSRTSLAAGPVVKQLPVFKESNMRAQLIDSIGSDFRIDILSFVDGDTLLAGSSKFSRQDIDRVISKGLISKFVQVDCPTGMDGCLSEHRGTRRHIHFGYHDVKIIDRNSPDSWVLVECDTGANVESAAWNVDGSRIIVASTNYLTIAQDDGKVIVHQNTYAERITSVAWQPSKSPLYAAKSKVCAITPTGEMLWESEDPGESGICIAVSSCGRLIAASNANADIALWNEKGVLLAQLKGLKGSGSWRARRGLAFSPDSKYLAHVAPVESSGFSIFNLESGLTQRTEVQNTDLVAWLPEPRNTLATTADERISFWSAALEPP